MRSSTFLPKILKLLVIATLTLPGALKAAPAAGLHPGFASVHPELSGELLLGELNCVACHAAGDAVKRRLASNEAPLLGTKGLAITPQYLRKFLENPQTAKPGSTMPDVLHGLNAPEKTTAVESLVHFLVSLSNTANTAPVAADEFKIQQGRLLYHQVGCVACHAPQEPASILVARNPEVATTAPNAAHMQKLEERSGPLGDLPRKMTVETLAAFLKDPLKVRPSGRMPSLSLTDAEAHAIAMYLLRSQITTASPDGVRPKTQGVAFQYYEGDFRETAELEKQKPRASGIMPAFGIGGRSNKQFFGLRLSAVLTVPSDGSYTFYTDSDDGSRLFIGDKLVVENDTIHGPTERQGSIELKAGEHPILVTFFNGGAGAELKVSYKGPGISKREIPTTALFTYGGQPMIPLGREPFTVDSSKAARGKELFASLGCAACHSGTDLKPNAAKALADLSGKDGCLAANPPAPAPRYALNDSQRAALSQVLARKNDLARPLTPADQVTRTLTALNCYACHNRDKIGGPEAERAEYFTVVGELDLGDEGRIPPLLTRVGAKLRPEWTREVLLNKGYVRPYMATRMPQFGERNVGHLPKAFEQADSTQQDSATPENLLDAKFGRNLVGTGGFACISCHTFGPHKSLGIPALDLTLTTRRLKKDWFHRYLLDPQSLRPGTRMPSFFPEGKSSRPDILAGNSDRQIDAIWAFLSRGSDGGLPPGLVQGKMELVATTEPVIHRHFIQGAGSRAIGVGYPEKANLAFDANDLRLALIWQGSFIDAAKHRTGRGDGFVPPLGYNVVRLPPGPAFANLNSPNEKWPDPISAKADLRLHGYSLDAKRRPTFNYAFGKVVIEDTPTPEPGEVDPFFRRTLVFRTEAPVENLWFRAWSGSRIEQQGGGIFVADGKVKLRFDVPGGAAPVVRQSGNNAELLVPIKFSGNSAQLTEEIVW
jgi:mono/diheme cytochrome c family protein